MGIIVEDTYIHFEYIDADKALGLLNRRTEAQFTESLLLKFAESELVKVYVNSSRKKGKTAHWDGLPVKTSGMSRVLFPGLYLKPPQAFPYQLALYGPAVIQAPDNTPHHRPECLWYAEVDELPAPEFKPTEIEQLASILKGEGRGSTATAVEVEVEVEAKPKPSHLLAISVLLDLLNKRERRTLNQAGVISEITEQHPDKHGLSKRNLENIFATARKAYKNAI